MGWNRPNEAVLPRRKPTGHFAFMGIVIAGVVLAALVFGFIMFHGRDSEKTSQVRKTQRISETNTRPSTKQTMSAETVSMPVSTSAIAQVDSSAGQDSVAATTSESEKAVVEPEPRAEYAIFDHEVENEIAAYLAIRPGQVMVGTPLYRDDLDKQFIESLKTPIIVLEDDSEYVKWLKRSMNEAKIAIKDELDQGRKLKDILIESRREYQKLNLYKRDLEFELGKLRSSEDVSDADIDDFVKAANIMLKEKGIDPITVNPLTSEMLKSDAERPED